MVTNWGPVSKNTQRSQTLSKTQSSKADAPAAVRMGNHRVLNPSMRKPIPHDIDKSDEASVVSCNNPTEAVLGEEVIPVPFVVEVHPSIEGVAWKALTSAFSKDPRHS